MILKDWQIFSQNLFEFTLEKQKLCNCLNVEKNDKIHQGEKKNTLDT